MTTEMSEGTDMSDVIPSDTRPNLIGRVWPVLDDGHIQLTDVMGDDAAICDAARTSYGKGTKSVSDNRTLIRYLMRHRHSSPFEMAEIKLGLRLPMDCMRQLVRHRTANLNEYSTRYSEAIEEMQRTEPDAWRLQAKDNKQGSAGFLENWTGEDGGPDRSNGSPEGPLDHQARMTARIPIGTPLTPGEALSIMEADHQKEARRIYEQRIAMGVAREQARKDLPLSNYTSLVWKCDLRNLLGFLLLRMDSHSQAEIRAYAEVIGHQIVAPLFPATWDAFCDYQLNAMSLTALDIEAIKGVLARPDMSSTPTTVLASLFTNTRERSECRAKLVRLGILDGDVE